MSKWSHVSGVIRYDAMPEMQDGKLNIAVLNGNPKVLNTVLLMQEEDNDIKFAVPEEIIKKVGVPSGQEGPLHYQILENPNKSHMDRYTMIIWGDLRNYDNVEELYEWFCDLTLDYMVRSAVFCVEVDGTPDKFQYVYDYNDGDPTIVETTIETENEKVEIEKDLVN